MNNIAITVLVLQTLLINVDAHGRLIDPPSRSSMWRYGFNTPVNYNDTQLNCGGFSHQMKNQGKCGICGDSWDGPRDNEAGGRYATGTITRTYRERETIRVTLDITANHGGWCEFRVCPNNNPNKPATEDCLNRHLLTLPSGVTRYQLPAGVHGQHSVQLVLPLGLTCSQCVFQWNWQTASNWGCDGDQCGKGHGPQEHFYGCADIAITGAGVQSLVTGAPMSSGGQSQLSSGFLPIGANNGPGQNVPIGQSSANCVATPYFKANFTSADKWCEDQCPIGNCPTQYCADSCRSSSASGPSRY